MKISSRSEEDPRSFKFLSVSSSNTCESPSRFKDEKTDFRFRNENPPFLSRARRSPELSRTFDFNSQRNFHQQAPFGPSSSPTLFGIISNKIDPPLATRSSVFSYISSSISHYFGITRDCILLLHSPRRRKVHRKRRRRAKLVALDASFPFAGARSSGKLPRRFHQRSTFGSRSRTWKTHF